MFAVPGWSLGAQGPARDTSSSKRKRKAQDRQKQTSKTSSGSPNAASDDSNRASKGSKRKASKPQNGSELHDGPANVYEDRPSKRQKQGKKSKASSVPQADDSDHASTGMKHAPMKPKSTFTPAKLTPLQAAMQKKLLGARFRHLNESLYTTPSKDAVSLFDKNPTFFDEYHSGFRSQVASWPENPVDTFVADLRRRGAIGMTKTGKPIRPEPEADDENLQPLVPLPRSKGKCVVADLGCGDASIAQQVKKFSSKAGIEVRSFDLQSKNSLVTKADISQLPLPESSVDVAIFCLALMGTNWIDFVEEAWRVLHWKGELWVAEIKSRFGKPERKTTLQGRKQKQKPDTKKQKYEADQKAAEALMDDAAGTDAPTEKTDVTAFIQILKKRGFVMENERGADMSNKMFVRMKFIKAVKPVKGKYKAALPSDASMAAKDKAWRSLLREDEEVDESSTLKPCLYKIR